MSRTSKGLTLLELMISVLLIASMLFAVWTIYHTGFTVFYNQVSRYDIKGQLSSAFISMTNELQQAVSTAAATATSAVFYADINSDGIDEKIEYTWSGVSGAPLNRIINDTETKALARSISAFAFSYYGANNVLLSFPVTLSEIQLAAADAAAVKGDETFHLRTKIRMRTI